MANQTRSASGPFGSQVSTVSLCLTPRAARAAAVSCVARNSSA